MADYYIKCTEKDRDGDILRVGWSLFPSTSIKNTLKNKREVIRDIDVKNYDVKTAYKRGGNWKIGEEVHTVDGDYIRTDRNKTPADNLDNISEC
ncbi:MAG: DUF3892 domain-containing protein [Halobacteriales archaeon]|nr:DUF3892 domain-containing protein [Halobacteriales archaeon]